MLGYITFIMASLRSSKDSTGVLKSVEEGALEVGDLERARKQCFLYMHPKKHFSRPPGNPYFAIAGYYCFFLTLYLEGIHEGHL